MRTQPPSQLRSKGDRALAALGRLLLRLRLTRGVAVLAYHDVPDADRFRAQLDVVDRYTQVVSTDRVLEGSFAGPAVCFTFDDGYRSVYGTAFPLLAERGWTATLYPVAGLVGTAEPFWWDEVTERLDRGTTVDGLPADVPAAVAHLKGVPDPRRRELIDALRRADPRDVRQPQLTWDEIRDLADVGWQIGNHSTTHPCLDRCDDEVIRTELRDAHERLTDELGQAPTTLAYPNGNVDGRIRDVADDLGYRTAFLFDHHLTRPDEQDPLLLSRVRTDATAPTDRFLGLVSGVHPAVHHLVGRS